MINGAFRIVFIGGRRLILREQSSSCECLAAARPEVVVPPGGSRQLAVVLNTGHLSGPLRIEQRYWSNDPRQPTLVLVLLVEVGPATSPESDGR